MREEGFDSGRHLQSAPSISHHSQGASGLPNIILIQLGLRLWVRHCGIAGRGSEKTNLSPCDGVNEAYSGRLPERHTSKGVINLSEGGYSNSLARKD